MPDDERQAEARERAKRILDDPKHRQPPPGKEPLPTGTPDDRGKPKPDAV